MQLVRVRGRRRMGGALAVVCVMTSGACGSPVLSVDDAAVMSGEKTHLVAYLERDAVLGIRRSVEHVKVRFFADDREVGEDDTDKDGRASVHVLVPPDVQRFTARAFVERRQLYAAGEVVTWNRRRVIIAVDVDHTIAQTDYKELLLDKDEDEISPLKRSVKTLNTLTQDYHVLYLTARPRFLRDKTRAWLREKGFPEGPLLTAEGVRQTVRSERFKRGKLHELRGYWPTLRIGIGNKASDAEAYGANEMLAIILETREHEERARHAIVLRDWKMVAEFFKANADTLTDADRLKEVLEGRRMLLRPVPRWREP